MVYLKFPTREEIARELERDATSCYGWTDKQFKIWWEKDPSNRNKDERYRQADLVLKMFRDKLVED